MDSQASQDTTTGVKAKPEKGFNLLRASFYLLAVVILGEMSMTMFAAFGCFGEVMSGDFKIGSCKDIGIEARAVFSELLNAVLALLLAGHIRPSTHPHLPTRPPPGQGDGQGG
jgi:hypothetical protein